MSGDRWPEIEELFALALEQPASERESYINARASSEEVAREVLSLLDSHHRSSLFDPLTERQDALESLRDAGVAERAAWHARLYRALEGRYTLDRELGRGGMAIVYLARDVRHDRAVAVKVLKPELAAAIGGERFLREIRVTANLQHPHILALFDSGTVEGFLYYVMPYVEGESLRDRLRREKQLPVDGAVEIAKAVAGALEYAHRHHVVHRDIKPENILLHDGQPLVADFGIALAVTEAGGRRVTESGLTLGTPSYMSPEQATGDREVDARSDIYSLGAVLYEMLSGEPPHTGPSAQTILARVATDEPRPLYQQRRTVPTHVGAAVHMALSKLPADRFASAAQFVDALTNPAFVSSSTTPPHGARSPRVPRRLAWPAGVALALAIVALMWFQRGPRRTSVVRQTITLRAVGESPGSVLLGAAIAPDGSAIVFVDSSASRSQLWIKERDQLDPAPIRGTEGATGGVTFSPNGEWIAYVAATRLCKISRRGGPPVTLADSAGQSLRPAWLEDGTIAFASREGRVLYRVSSDGGPTERLLSSADVGRLMVHLAPLPEARGVLITGLAESFQTSDLLVLDLATRKVSTLVAGAGWGAYAGTGQLVFGLRDGSLWAAPIELSDYTLGQSVPVESGIRTVVGMAEVTLGADGTLLYVRGEAVLEHLVSVDRQGKATPLDPEFSLRGNPYEVSLSLAPDGRRLAVTLPRQETYTGGVASDIYVKRFPVGPGARITFDGTSNRRPSWSPDGTQLLFISNRDGDGDRVWSKRVDGGGAATLVAEEGRQIYEAEWTPDGEWLVYRTDDDPGAVGLGDILAIHIGDSTPRPLVATGAEETSPTVSWDSHWLAYVSDQTGRKEVYVRPFPNVDGGTWLISTNGGTEPAWARSGRELFYRDGAGNMVAVTVATTGASFEMLDRRALFDARHYLPDDDHRYYDVTPDGERFIMISLGAAGAPGDLVMVSHFDEELRRAKR